MSIARQFDFCIAADCEYDQDFITLLEGKLQEQGRSTYVVWPHNLEETVRLLRSGRLSFRFLLDRASNTSPEFIELYRILCAGGAGFLDNPETMLWASDKATMHLEFVSSGIRVPYTHIVAPFNTARDIPLSRAELTHLGGLFFIKPANTTGGGIGVFGDGTCLEDILSVRKEHKGDKYLIQEKILPLERDGKRFWFRAFYACALVLVTWWHDLTHLYEPPAEGEVERYGLEPMFEMVRKIARICRLNFFSTEIVLDPQGRFVAVDYVNESCDLRPQSRYADGVPDPILVAIAERLAAFIHQKLG